MSPTLLLCLALAAPVPRDADPIRTGFRFQSGSWLVEVYKESADGSVCVREVGDESFTYLKAEKYTREEVREDLAKWPQPYSVRVPKGWPVRRK